MRTPFWPVVILFFAAGFISCQKEIEENTATRTSTDSSLVRQIIIRDSTRPPGSDTGTHFIFSYDAQNRIQRVKAYIYAFTPAAVNLVEYEYGYNGPDTLPALMRIKSWYDPSQFSSPPTDTDTIYFFYQGDKIRKDSIITHYGYSTSNVTEYESITPQKIKITKREVFRSNGSVLTSKSGFVYINASNGNQVEFRDTTVFITGHLIDRKINNTYDTKINSLNKIALRYLFYCPEEVTEYYPQKIPNLLILNNINNRLQKTVIINTGTPVISRLAYDYNTRDLQIVRRDPDLLDVRTWVYLYNL